MRKTNFLSLAVLCLGLAACSSLGGAHHSDGSAVYLDKARLEALEFQPAPAPGSPLDRADFLELNSWQARRTPAQCARAAAEGEAYFDQFFGPLKPFTWPLSKDGRAFILRVRADIGTAVNIFKNRSARPRPFRRDPQLAPCLGKIGGLAYPSGHAATARVYALMLTEIAPTRRAEFLARADEAALNRVIGGVHHPSDIEAGKKLGDILFNRFMQNAEFRANLEKLRSYAAK
ncbi:MAG TPA: phosphatase PAP2 family protein [Elusimicrobiales bacterium]|nr:phosphatase PAP2 family protein [Elusimicrobiales bacterium]